MRDRIRAIILDAPGISFVGDDSTVIAESVADAIMDIVRRPEPDKVRLSVNLAPDVAAALRYLADRKGVSITEAVRDAIATEKFIQDEIAKGGAFIVRRGNVESEILFR